MEAEKIRRQKEKEEAHKQAVLEKIRREKGEKQGLIKEEPVAAVARAEVTEAVVQIRTASGALTWKVKIVIIRIKFFKQEK